MAPLRGAGHSQTGKVNHRRAEKHRRQLPRGSPSAGRQLLEASFVFLRRGNPTFLVKGQIQYPIFRRPRNRTSDFGSRGQGFPKKQGKAGAARPTSPLAPRLNVPVINWARRRRGGDSFPQQWFRSMTPPRPSPGDSQKGPFFMLISLGLTKKVTRLPAGTGEVEVLNQTRSNAPHRAETEKKGPALPHRPFSIRLYVALSSEGFLDQAL